MPKGERAARAASPPRERCARRASPFPPCQVCEIDPKWLVEMAPRFFRAADPHKLSRRKRHERIEPLYDRRALFLSLPGSTILPRSVP